MQSTGSMSPYSAFFTAYVTKAACARLDITIPRPIKCSNRNCLAKESSTVGLKHPTH